MTSSSPENGTTYGIEPPGYRLPAAAHVGKVRLHVSDLERSVTYYEDVLGFRVKDRSADRVTLVARGDDHSLIELHGREGSMPAPRHGRLGLYHFAILLPDRASLGRFVAHLGAVGVRAGASDHLVSEALYLQDPDGLGIEVYADRPRSSWRQQDGELQMATQPLDLDSVVREAGGERWAGMPSGTVIGHVHLHVGDIGEAEAFYHRALGLDRVVWSYPGALFLSAGGYHHHLGVNTWAAGAAPAGEGEARLLEWEIVVPADGDAEDVAKSLSAAGFEVERRPDGLSVRDPWGTALRIRSE